MIDSTAAPNSEVHLQSPDGHIPLSPTTDQQGIMKCSICIATRNKSQELDTTIASIVEQAYHELEIIVVDDGSTDSTQLVCERYPVIYRYLDNARYRNPSVARNTAYRLATGDVIIAQSDDTMHVSTDEGANVIECLVNRLEPGEFLIARVFNYDVQTDRRLRLYTGLEFPRPFFFLGALWRKDLYAVGGNDEEFTEPGFEDDWFGDCLVQGLGLTPRFSGDIVGYHQDHTRPQGLSSKVVPSEELHKKKRRLAEMGEIPWQASGGPWKYE